MTFKELEEMIDREETNFDDSYLNAWNFGQRSGNSINTSQTEQERLSFVISAEDCLVTS